MSKSSYLPCLLFFSYCLCGNVRADTLFTVTVDTTPIAGSAGIMAFDLLGGNPPEENHAVITKFSSTAALLGESSSGSVGGELVPGPLTLRADQFFNEFQEQVSYGKGVTTFALDLSAAFLAGGVPDSFSFFLLDANSIPYVTTDPTGADALFSIDLMSPGMTASVYTSAFATAAVTASTVVSPEPGSRSLVCLILVIFLLTIVKDRRYKNAYHDRSVQPFRSVRVLNRRE